MGAERRPALELCQMLLAENGEAPGVGTGSSDEGKWKVEAVIMQSFKS